jgi:isopenicillin N synthase-like dioxygenase
MLMHEVPTADPRHGGPLDGPNQWPDLPGFRSAVTAYEAAMYGVCLRLLPTLALALGLPPDWFASYFAQPTAFLRLLHYPPQAADAPDDRGGLQVQRRDGTWLDAPPIADTWVVNVADLLSRWTNGRWQSTQHRVTNVSGADRYSCPYFFDMSMDSSIAVLPTCQGPANPP